MSKSRSARTIFPEGLSSTETRSSEGEVHTDPITVKNGGAKLDLVVGQLYYDFSDPFHKLWYEVEKLGDECSYVIAGSAMATRKRRANKHGTTLLFLGRCHGWSMTSGPCNTYLYFLNNRQVIMTVVSIETPELKRIKLWPYDESLIHKNVFYPE